MTRTLNNRFSVRCLLAHGGAYWPPLRITFPDGSQEDAFPPQNCPTSPQAAKAVADEFPRMHPNDRAELEAKVFYALRDWREEQKG